MSILTKEVIQKILNDDWLLMDDCEGLENCTVIKELARMALSAMDSEPVAWSNGCNKSVPAALRYLAEKPRPIGGESSFNTAHLYQLAREIEFMAEAPLYRHAQQSVVDADDNFYSWFGREWQENYQHNQYTTAAKQMLGVMAESAWKAGRHAAMLQGAENADARCGNSPVIPDGYVMVPKEPTQAMCAAFNDSDYGRKSLRERYVAMLAAAAHDTPALNSVQSVATVPGKWVPVSERMPETDGNYWGWWSESKRQGPVWFIKSELQAQFQSHEITHWMPLPAAPQEVKGE
ncbi:DUF551 domain-containing protein [Klebsiella michiganensis]|uniref:DUF551 domain-containing protein n=1 Tax=Klebsiella michiganensis TaxID=1134687 RepID=UPI001D192076|nr:DUF551 domain-containing protein [Klebsiella michiganensis]